MNVTSIIAIIAAMLTALTSWFLSRMSHNAGVIQRIDRELGECHQDIEGLDERVSLHVEQIWTSVDSCTDRLHALERIDRELGEHGRDITGLGERVSRHVTEIKASIVVCAERLQALERIEQELREHQRDIGGLGERVSRGVAKCETRVEACTARLGTLESTFVVEVQQLWNALHTIQQKPPTDKSSGGPRRFKEDNLCGLAPRSDGL